MTTLVQSLAALNPYINNKKIKHLHYEVHHNTRRGKKTLDCV